MLKVDGKYESGLKEVPLTTKSIETRTKSKTPVSLFREEFITSITLEDLFTV